MGSLTIRNLDDELLAQLKERAKANERSMEGEARVALQALIEGAAPSTPKPPPREPKIMTKADWDEIMARVNIYMEGKTTPATAVEDIRAWRDGEI